MKGHIRKRGENTWAIIVDLPRGSDGKRRQKWFTCHGTKKDAERFLTDKLFEVNSGGHAVPSDVTVEDILLKWEQHHAKYNTEISTQRAYRSIIHDHIIPSIGSIPLAKLTPEQIADYYSLNCDTSKTHGAWHETV